MAILSNADIEEEMNSGRIVIDPRPTNIGPMSLDLTVDEVSELEMGHSRELFEELNWFGCYPLEDLADSVHWKAKRPDTFDGGYLLRKYHWYQVKHREKIRSETFESRLVKRSSAARRGLYQLAESIEDKTPTEIVVPFISNVVKKGESITQVVFSEPLTRHLTCEEFNRISRNDFGYIHEDNQIEQDMLFTTAPGITEQKLQRIMKNDDASLGLAIDPVVKYFNDSEDENGILYSKDKFLEIDLREKSVPTFGEHTKFFTLAKSFEKIHIGNKYAGELKRAAPTPLLQPVHPYDALAQILTGQYIHATVTNCSAPYIQPGSDGHVVFEIPQGSAIQPYTHMSLTLTPVRTPGISYSNRLNKTGEIIVP